MAEDIPIEKLYSHPIVQELLEKIDKSKDLENIKIPYIKKDKVLMSPGVWNNYYYGPESIRDAYLKTKWNNKEVRSLFLDHLDKNSRQWVGEIQNPRMSGEDLIGDLVIVDKPMAQKIEYGAKLGISPKVHGEEDNNEMLSFVFDNFSIVVNPAVKTAYINNMEVNGKMAKEEKPIKQPETPKETEKTDVPKEEIPEVTEGDELMDTLSEIDIKNGVAEIAKKAKEIRKKGESWTAAIRRAAKMLSEEELAKKKEPKEEEKMVDSDVVDQIIKLAELLKKKKEYPYPKEEKEKKYPYPYKEDVEMKKKEEEEKKKKEEEEMKKKEEEDKKEKEMKEQINELSEKVTKLTAKLNEPDKLSKKTEELSAMTTEDLVRKEPDRAMLNVLNRL